LKELLLNFRKYKEIPVYCSAKIDKLVNLPSSIYSIVIILNRLKEVKLLDLHTSYHLSSRVHVSSVISALNPRFHFMKLLRAQGLIDFGLSVVLNAFIGI
jgi:hypothetical protein